MGDSAADMGPAAITARLRELSRLSAAHAVVSVPDMSPRAIGDRLREWSEVSRLCAELLRVGAGRGGAGR